MSESLSASVEYSIIRSNDMAETPIQTPPGFAELSKIEQVKYVQALWDQITEQEVEIPVPESHLRLAEARLQRYRESPSSHPAFDMLDHLAKDRK